MFFNRKTYILVSVTLAIASVFFYFYSEDFSGTQGNHDAYTAIYHVSASQQVDSMIALKDSTVDELGAVDESIDNNDADKNHSVHDDLMDIYDPVVTGIDFSFAHISESFTMLSGGKIYVMRSDGGDIIGVVVYDKGGDVAMVVPYKHAYTQISPFYEQAQGMPDYDFPQVKMQDAITKAQTLLGPASVKYIGVDTIDGISFGPQDIYHIIRAGSETIYVSAENGTLLRRDDVELLRTKYALAEILVPGKFDVDDVIDVIGMERARQVLAAHRDIMTDEAMLRNSDATSLLDAYAAYQKAIIDIAGENAKHFFVVDSIATILQSSGEVESVD